MSEGGFPMSVIVTGFFITSFAYLLCFCCCIVQFFIRRSRSRRRRNGAVLTGVHANGEGQRNDTLKKKFLKQFKEGLKQLSSVGGFGGEESVVDQDVSCPICFEEYAGDPSKVLIGYVNNCNHYFHFECIWKWLEDHPNCPLCREEVLLKEDNIMGMSLNSVHSLQHDRQTTPDVPSSAVDEQLCERVKTVFSRPADPTGVDRIQRCDEQTVHLTVPGVDGCADGGPASRRGSLPSESSRTTLGHICVINLQESRPEAGTIGSGAAFPGCGTHALDLDLDDHEQFDDTFNRQDRDLDDGGHISGSDHTNRVTVVSTDTVNYTAYLPDLV